METEGLEGIKRRGEELEEQFDQYYGRLYPDRNTTLEELSPEQFEEFEKDLGQLIDGFEQLKTLKDESLETDPKSIKLNENENQNHSPNDEALSPTKLTSGLCETWKSAQNAESYIHPEQKVAFLPPNEADNGVNENSPTISV